MNELKRILSSPQFWALSLLYGISFYLILEYGWKLAIGILIFGWAINLGGHFKKMEDKNE